MAKIHRNYTVDEIARLYDVHRNTVRQWIKQGLPLCDERRPALILGAALGEFLAAKRKRNKRPCKPGEIYCVRCRVPQRPALDMADYQPLTVSSGNLVGLCPACDGTIYRRVGFAGLNAAKGGLDVRITQAREHIAENGAPSVNCDSSKEA